MSNEASEKMMTLLQELAGLKEIDATERGRTRQKQAARKQRQRRRTEVRKQIKQVAAEKRVGE